MDAGLMKKYCWNRSGIGEENLAEIEAGLIIKILLNESGIFYKINIIFCAELSETNSRAELSAPNCPAPNCPRRIVHTELSCAELSGHPLPVLLQSVWSDFLDAVAVSPHWACWISEMLSMLSMWLTSGAIKIQWDCVAMGRFLELSY